MRRPLATPSPPLLDVLGASWELDAPVTGVAWDGDLAGFALGDGSVAMGRAEWDGAARLDPCEGGTQLTPGTAPAPPMARQRVHRGACLSVTAMQGGGFLSGGDDGDVIRTDAQGISSMVGRHSGQWVNLVAAGADGLVAAAVGRRVHLLGPAVQSLDLPASVRALAFDASGTRLAMAHYRGVTLWKLGDALRTLPTLGCPLSLAWSPDGAYVVCGLQENALHGWRLSDGGDIEMGGYPGQPRSLSFSGDGRVLASSGAPQVVCWRFDPPSAGSQPMECGLPNSRLPLCQVAYHPRYPLIAAGYHNGAVMLCQPGSDDVLFVKSAAGGSVSALAWSTDGTRLAMGTQGGSAGLVTLPGLLFQRVRPPAAGVTLERSMA